MKRRAWLFAFVTLLEAPLLVWAVSRRHTPLEYMVAGTMATTVCLLAAFVRLVTQRRI